MEPDPNCEFCGGDGVVRYPVLNEDAHEYEDVGERPCICTKEELTEPEDYNGNYF